MLHLLKKCFNPLHLQYQVVFSLLRIAFFVLLKWESGIFRHRVCSRSCSFRELSSRFLLFLDWRLGHLLSFQGVLYPIKGLMTHKEIIYIYNRYLLLVINMLFTNHQYMRKFLNISLDHIHTFIRYFYIQWKSLTTSLIQSYTQMKKRFSQK